MRKIRLLMVGAMVALFTLISIQTATAKCYLIGGVNGNGWNPSIGVELTDEGNDVYTGICTFTGSYFGITTQLGANGDDWNTCNANRYGAPSKDYELTVGSSVAIQKGEYSFKVTDSTNPYKITVDIANMTILIEDIKLPELTITPASGSVAVGTKVEMSCDDAECTIYYTMDGSEPSSASDVYLEPITLSEGEVTLKAIAISPDEKMKSLISTYNYNVTDEQSAITVNFKKPEDWNTVNIWAWDNNYLNLNAPGTNWPGETMTDEGNGWWSYTFADDVTLANIIFSNGSGVQTGDNKNIVKSAYFEFAGNQVPATTVPAPDPSKQAITVGFKKPADWNSMYLWGWNGGDNYTGGTWPGIELTDEDGDGWYYHTFDATVTSVDAIFSDNGSDASKKEILGITESAAYEFRMDATNGEVLTYKELTSAKEFTGEVVIPDYEIVTIKAPVTYSTLTLANNAEIKVDAAAGGSVNITQLEVIKTFTYAGTDANKEWFSLGLPFNVYAGQGQVYKQQGDGSYVEAIQGTDYVTFDYDGANRAVNGKGDNWVMYDDNKSKLGELIQFAEAGTCTYKFATSAPLDAINAINEGRDGSRDFNDDPKTTDDNGWNLIPAGKTYRADYAIDGVSVFQMFNNDGTFNAATTSATALKPGTVFAVQLTKPIEGSSLSSNESTDAEVETYTFDLVDADGKVIDRVFMFDGSNKAQYRVGKMDALAANKAQMSIQANGKEYCAYSTLASDANKTYTVSLANAPKGAKLVMTAAGNQSVSIDGAATTLGTAVDVASGNINITIGSQTTSVGDAAAIAAKVYSANGTIIIEGAEGAYAVVNMSGITVATGVAEGKTSIDVAAGVYVVNVAGEYSKVIVK